MGGGVSKFRADGHEVGLDVEVDGSGGFDGDSAAKGTGVVCEFREIWQEQRFSSGKYDIRGGAGGNAVSEFVDAPRCSLGLPRCVGGIAERAAEVAA